MLQKHTDLIAKDKTARAKLSKASSKACTALTKELKLHLSVHAAALKAHGDSVDGWGMYDADGDGDDDDAADGDDDGDGDDTEGAEGGKPTKKPKRKIAASGVSSESGEWDETRVELNVRKLLKRRNVRAAGDRSAANWIKLLSRAATVSPRAELLVLSHTVPAEFDSTTALGAAMKPQIWRDAVAHTARILAIVKQSGGSLALIGDGDETDFDPTTFTAGGGSGGSGGGARRERALLGASLLTDGDDDDGGADDSASDLASSQVTGTDTDVSVAVSESAPLVISGNLGAMVERLDFEWTKSVQTAAPSTPEYLQRLRDEPALIHLAHDVHAHYAASGATRRAALVAELILEHLYFRAHDRALYERLSKATPTVAPFSSAWMASDHAARVHEVAKYVFAHGAERGKTRALLMCVFHDAANGRYAEARDQLLMSYTQETIHYADVSTMVLFNRAMARLGIAAFELGLINDAHSCLAELYGGHVRELLAQGTASRYGERTVDQERAEQQRQIPFHMWINLDLLEAVHIVAALLLEVPNMAVHEHGDGGKRRVISRALRRHLDYAERQVFSGPPESARDHALFAARALKRGDWRECARLVEGLQAWSLLRDAAAVRTMLGRVVRREALRTYLLRFASAYDSLALPQLAAMFDLSEVDTHAIVSRMMSKDELAAAWDQPSGSIAMHGVEPTRLQSLALQFAERAATFVENNERLFDARTGGHAFADNDKEKLRERERGSGAPKLRGPKVVRGGNASSNYAARSGGGGGASAGAGNQRRAAAGGNNSKPVGAAQQGATSGGNKQASNSK